MMKTKLLFFVVAAILALVIIGCNPAGKEVALQVTYDEFMQQKSQARNTTMTSRDASKITLPSNASTGFRWELTGISDKAVIAQDGVSEYVLPENSTVVGAYGKEIWTFKPLQRGTSIISLAYSQPWAGGTKKEWTITIEVKVR
jgi:predicted secreted protein